MRLITMLIEINLQYIQQAITLLLQKQTMAYLVPLYMIIYFQLVISHHHTHLLVKDPNL